MAKIIRGTEVKYNVHIDPLNQVPMSDYDFRVSLITGRSRVDTYKSECIKVDKDNYLAMFDTSALRPGPVSVEVTAFIPDPDFPDQDRAEIVRLQTEDEVIL